MKPIYAIAAASMLFLSQAHAKKMTKAEAEALVTKIEAAAADQNIKFEKIIHLSRSTVVLENPSYVSPLGEMYLIENAGDICSVIFNYGAFDIRSKSLLDRKEDEVIATVMGDDNTIFSTVRESLDSAKLLGRNKPPEYIVKATCNLPPEERPTYGN